MRNHFPTPFLRPVLTYKAKDFTRKENHKQIFPRNADATILKKKTQKSHLEIH